MFNSNGMSPPTFNSIIGGKPKKPVKNYIGCSFMTFACPPHPPPSLGLLFWVAGNDISSSFVEFADLWKKRGRWKEGESIKKFCKKKKNDLIQELISRVESSMTSAAAAAETFFLVLLLKCNENLNCLFDRVLIAALFELLTVCVIDNFIIGTS